MDTTAFDLSPIQADIQARAQAFGEKWAPLATRIDREDTTPIADMVRDTVDMGPAGITIPVEYGGKGLRAIEFPKTLDVSVAKLHAADVGRDARWKAMQILGGNGLVTGFPPERCFRDVIVSSIAGGTMQVLKNTIAAQILGKKLDQRR
ncbi:acyl-CoA dehydrogenase family protein [Nocardia nova]|uniref:acyl-CoA dehydrogenase family protein n=1 Tax=Nocardia nova TaxID=37330 RepID=UPI0018961B0C|nr:acyl-CoA dehydrogenase family protein [Nocardia nova]MBF6148873.1 acyl-CoA dehydrogenase family protein [Nocardia nova]MDN2495556.1 hypothetical protein [Nocardia nova]